MLLVDMMVELFLGVNHNVTLVTRVQVCACEVHTLNVPYCVGPVSAKLSTLSALIFSNVASSINPLCILHENLVSIISIYLKCSQNVPIEEQISREQMQFIAIFFKRFIGQKLSKFPLKFALGVRMLRYFVVFYDFKTNIVYLCFLTTKLLLL